MKEKLRNENCKFKEKYTLCSVRQKQLAITNFCCSFCHWAAPARTFPFQLVLAWGSECDGGTDADLKLKIFCGVGFQQISPSDHKAQDGQLHWCCPWSLTAADPARWPHAAGGSFPCSPGKSSCSEEVLCFTRGYRKSVLPWRYTHRNEFLTNHHSFDSDFHFCLPDRKKNNNNWLNQNVFPLQNTDFQFRSVTMLKCHHFCWFDSKTFFTQSLPEARQWQATALSAAAENSPVPVLHVTRVKQICAGAQCLTAAHRASSSLPRAFLGAARHLFVSCVFSALTKLCNQCFANSDPAIHGITIKMFSLS